MMPEISLNVLDVAQNSIRAGAGLIEISVTCDTVLDTLTIIIADNGCGMTKEQIEHAEDPFYTTRKTRKVGLGIPFFKFAALAAGGSFDITSSVGTGTKVTAMFKLSHIDRMPLGDMTSTVHALITLNPCIDFLYTYSVDKRSFTLDTRELKQILNGVSVNEPEISTYLKSFLLENTKETDNGLLF